SRRAIHAAKARPVDPGRPGGRSGDAGGEPMTEDVDLVDALPPAAPSGLNEADDVRSRVVGRRPAAPPAVAGVRRRDRPDASGLAHGTALEVVSVRGRRVVLKQAQPRPDGGWRWTLLLGTGLELGLQLELELQLAQHAPRGHTAAEIAVSASLGFEQQELGLRSYEAVDAEV